MTEQTPSWLDQKSSTPAIKLLIAINSIIFVAVFADAFLSNVADASDQQLCILFFAIPSFTLEKWGANTTTNTILLHQYWRLIASSFLHLSPVHLLANMYVLWDFNRLTERFYGSAKYIIIYLIAALGSSAISLLFLNPDSVSVGASGAIFGSFGALVAFFVVHRASFPSIFIGMYKKIFFVFFVYAVTCAYLFKDMDNAAHFGGFLIGACTALCLMPTKPGVTSIRKIDLLRLSSVGITLAVCLLFDNMHITNNPVALAHLSAVQAGDLSKRNEYDQSLLYLNRAIALDPRNADYYADRAVIYGKMEKYEDDLKDCRFALVLDPLSKRALVEQAYAYHSLYNYQKAVQTYSRLLAVKPKSAVAYNDRAWSYAAMGDYKRAMQDCETALQLNYKLSLAYDTRGVAHLLAGDMASAQKDFDKCIELKPSDGAAYYHRAFVCEKLGEHQQAEADLCKARAFNYKPERWEKQFLL